MTTQKTSTLLWILFLQLLSTGLMAAEYTWDKGASTLDWNDPLNWTSNTKPGTADTARFDATGLVAGDTVLLGTNQTIKTLRLNAAPNNVTISGGGLYSLSLLNGYIQGNTGGSTVSLTIDAPIILGAAGAFEAQGGYGSKLTLAGAISDGGNGLGVTFWNQSGQDFVLKGSNTYSGNTVVQGRNVTIDGPNGTLRNSKLILRQGNSAVTTLMLSNTTHVNTNRLSDTFAIGFENNGGCVRLDGNATTPVIENAGVLELTSGTAWLEASYVKDSGSAVDLKFAGLIRSPGTALLVMRDTTADRSNWNNTPTITIAGLADGYLPYAAPFFWDPTHIYAEGGQLKRFTAYTALPASGGDSNILYQADNGQTLAGSLQTRGLIIRNDAAPKTLELGSYDLRLADGSVGFRGNNGRSHTIQSTGGKLIFGKEDVVVFGDGSGAAVMTISAPIATDATGPYNMLILTRTIGRLALTGEDQIGNYVHLTMPNNSRLELGGPSDRTFSGNITGLMQLTKSGTGTLRLTGSDLRGSGDMQVTGGRLAIGSTTALRSNPWDDNNIVLTNAVLEVESGITWNGRFTIRANTTITGDGKINTAKTIGNLVHVAPGHAVGKLTTAALTFSTGSHLDWELGAGTTTAGTDYDLLRVEGALVLPANSTAMTVNIYDAAEGAATVKGKSFTVAEWTGADPATTPAWTFVNHSETTLDTTGAVMTVDTANNKLVLTGLKNKRPNTTIVVVR